MAARADKERCYVPAGTVRVAHGANCDCQRVRRDPVNVITWGLLVPFCGVLVVGLLQAACRGAL